MVASGVKLNPGYGGTEFGSPTYAIPRKGDENDWAYMEFSERASIRWVPQGDGTYECQFLVSDIPFKPVSMLTFRLSDQRNVPTFCRGFGGCSGLCHLGSLGETSDEKLSVENVRSELKISPRLVIPNSWLSVGRIDDVIIHSSGEKTVPAPMEDIILSSP